MFGEKRVETIAVYKEERVKVYGITEKTDLALGILSFPAKTTEIWGRRISDLEKFINRFELVTYHATQKSVTELHLLFDKKHAPKLYDTFREWQITEQNTEFTLQQPVEVIYLFGPHFQDRFGIVDIAFTALLQNNIDILVSGCAGTSMYFVTSKNNGGKGVKILSNTFLIPTHI